LFLVFKWFQLFIIPSNVPRVHLIFSVHWTFIVSFGFLRCNCDFTLPWHVADYAQRRSEFCVLRPESWILRMGNVAPRTETTMATT